jgi:hypothetical protein
LGARAGEAGRRARSGVVHLTSHGGVASREGALAPLPKKDVEVLGDFNVADMHRESVNHHCVLAFKR